MRRHLADRPLAYLDTETTGLDPSRHEIIDIAIVFNLPRVLRAEGEPWTRNLVVRDGVAVYQTLIRPARIEDASPEALQINGYASDPGPWRSAPEFGQVAEDIYEILANTIMVGHNVAFDGAFLEAELRRAGVGKRLPYHRIDTVTLAHEHLVPCGLDSLSLKNVCTMLGISNEGEHRALPDALRCRAVHRTLSRASRMDRLLWKLRRLIG